VLGQVLLIFATSDGDGGDRSHDDVPRVGAQVLLGKVIDAELLAAHTEEGPWSNVACLGLTQQACREAVDGPVELSDALGHVEDLEGMTRNSSPHVLGVPKCDAAIALGASVENRVFQSAVRFGAARDALVFDSAMIDRQMPKASLHLSAILEKVGEEQLARLPETGQESSRRVCHLRGRLPPRLLRAQHLPPILQALVRPDAGSLPRATIANAMPAPGRLAQQEKPFVFNAIEHPRMGSPTSARC